MVTATTVACVVLIVSCLALLRVLIDVMNAYDDLRRDYNALSDAYDDLRRDYNALCLLDDDVLDRYAS